MSGLDNVFIRAYTKDAVDVVHPEPPVVVEPAAQPVASSPIQSTVPQSWHRIDSPVQSSAEMADSAPSGRPSPDEVSGIDKTEQAPPIEKPPAPVESPSPIPSESINRAPQQDLRLPRSAAVDSGSAQVVVMPPEMHLFVAPVETKPEFEEPRPVDPPPAPLPVKNTEPVGFGRIDEPHVSAVPAPHFNPVEVVQAPGLTVFQAEPIAETTQTKDDDQPKEKVVIHQPEISAIAPTEPRRPRATSFNPVWEIEEVQWPPICDQLLLEDKASFAQIGRSLIAAARDSKKVACVASQFRGEGRTTMTLCLARELSEAGRRVLLIDADFHSPAIADSLEIGVGTPWNEVVEQEIPINEGAIQIADGKLTLLALDSEYPVRGLSLSDERVTQLIKDISNEFDIVLVDAGPLSETEIHGIDVSLLICDCRQTTRGQTDRVAHQLKSTGVEVLGVAKNFDQVLPPANAFAPH